MNDIIITWAMVSLASGGLGVLGGIWLASRRRQRAEPGAASAKALETQIARLFETQSLAITSAQRTAREEHTSAMERQPLLLQRAMESELARYSALQARRDEATARQFSEWQTEQQQSFAALEATSAAQLASFLKSLTALRTRDLPPVGPPVSPAAALPARVPAASPAVPTPMPMPAPAPAPSNRPSARPPELLSTPITPPAPMADASPPARELSDAEIDAMPPELPPEVPRKRILPAPKSPAMGRL